MTANESQQIQERSEFAKENQVVVKREPAKTGSTLLFDFAWRQGLDEIS